MTKSSYKISHFVPKKSSVSGKKPSDTILVEGELAVNTASEKIYLRNNVDSSLIDEKIATFSSDKYIADNYLPLSGGTMPMARGDYGHTKYNGEGMVTTFTPPTLSSNEVYLFQTSSDGIKASYISSGGSTDSQYYTLENNSGITIAYETKSNGSSTWSNKKNVKFTISGLTTSTENTLSIKTQGSGLTVTSSYTQFDSDIKMPYMGDNVVLQDLISGNSYVTSQALNDLNQRMFEYLPLSGGTMNGNIVLKDSDSTIQIVCNSTTYEMNMNKAIEIGLFNKYINYKAVDLGLTSGTLWMDRNVGAEKDTDYGLYFAWGETDGYSGITTDKQFSWSDYKYANGTSTKLTKYCNDSSYGNSGYTDSLTTLETTDDSALQNAHKFVMPTEAQLQELIDETTYTWTTKNGVNGGLFTSKVNSNSIFLPAAGGCSNGSQGTVGEYGGLWSSSLGESDPYDAWCLGFNSDGVDLNGYENRCGGLSVRGVVSSSK